MLWKLIAAGVIALALMGAVASFIHSQRQIGEATVRAELLEQQKRAAEENERINAEGKAAAIRLWRAAEKRNQVADAKAASDATERKAVSDQHAKEDAAWAAYRSEPVHPFAVDQLRTATLIAAHESRGDFVPPGTPIQTSTSVSADSGQPDQRWSARLRAFLGGANPKGLGAR